MGDWAGELTNAFEGNRQKQKQIEGDAVAEFKAIRDKHDEADAQLEKEYEEAAKSVGEGFTESELDARVAAGMGKLDEIQSGYR